MVIYEDSMAVELLVSDRLQAAKTLEATTLGRAEPQTESSPWVAPGSDRTPGKPDAVVGSGTDRSD